MLSAMNVRYVPMMTRMTAGKKFWMAYKATFVRREMR